MDKAISAAEANRNFSMLLREVRERHSTAFNGLGAALRNLALIWLSSCHAEGSGRKIFHRP
jgi:hypothetical protein